MKAILQLALLIFLSSACCMQALAATQIPKRVALVIGNADYGAVGALPNPVNDAKAVSDALRRLGFEVLFRSNADFDGMRRALRDFSDLASGADIGLVYYAGHGIEVDKKNFLIPVDAALKADKDVEFEAISLDSVLSSLDGNARLKLVLLDACRDNPFLSNMKRSVAKRSIGRGLAATNPVNGMLISYAAMEGATASDGDGAHSPYTQSLLDNIETPGVELNLLFRKIRDDVLLKTNNEQEPFFYASLPGTPVYLKQRPDEDIDVMSKPVPAAALDWNNIKDTKNEAVLKAFLKAHSDPIYGALAQERLAMLSTETLAELPLQPAPAIDVSEIQKELVRVGCATGGVDGKWGKSTQRSASAFTKFAKLGISANEPTQELLDALKSTSLKVCPAVKVRPKPAMKKSSTAAVEKSKPTAKVLQAKKQPASKSNCFTFNGSQVCD